MPDGALGKSRWRHRLLQLKETTFEEIGGPVPASRLGAANVIAARRGRVSYTFGRLFCC